jgi:hypothetical protein
MHSASAKTSTAASLMASFAERTGLTSDRPSQRYLWTDAFAVCNFLALAGATGDKRYTDLALRLVDRVHRVLGRHRRDDSRAGWISGLDEREGELHPTRGGLRIGKRLPERRHEDPFDERLEWERDGQYFHYLTKWMHALDQVARATRDPRFNLWARELAEVAHASFSYRPRAAGGARMVWKMSTDLSRPLVPSMGQHDPLDGFITCIQLEATASQLSDPAPGPSLKRARAEFAAMLEASDLRTSDPLGLGGLLSDACRLAQLIERKAYPRAALLERLLAAALDGLWQHARLRDTRQPASQRLAFRELGLAIGLSSLELLERAEGAELRAHLAALAPYSPLASEIESFWLDPENRRSETWAEHRDINEVMLATSLAPDGYLLL